jgi:hypothetical protein
MLSIATNLNHVFTEIPNRRISAQSGQFTSLICVYQGMDVDYPAWNPRRGSAHPQFPSMYLQTINREDRGGGLIEVSLVYGGTTLQQQNYTDLLIQIDVLQQSFSWSGPASYKGVVVQFTFDVQYTTISVSFSYTTYKYLSGAIFQSMAGGFIQIIGLPFTNITTTPLSPGIYTGFPTIPVPIKPLQMLTRFNCQQQTPSNTTTAGSPDVVNTPGIWKCTETWQLAFNHGSLGFYEPNDISPHP